MQTLKPLHATLPIACLGVVLFTSATTVAAPLAGLYGGTACPVVSQSDVYTGATGELSQGPMWQSNVAPGADTLVYMPNLAKATWSGSQEICGISANHMTLTLNADLHVKELWFREGTLNDRGYDVYAERLIDRVHNWTIEFNGSTHRAQGGNKFVGNYEIGRGAGFLLEILQGSAGVEWVPGDIISGDIRSYRVRNYWGDMTVRQKPGFGYDMSAGLTVSNASATAIMLGRTSATDQAEILLDWDTGATTGEIDWTLRWKGDHVAQLKSWHALGQLEIGTLPANVAAFDANTNIFYDAVDGYTYVGFIGVAVDTDGDGVSDPDDVCPAEAASGYDFDGDGCIDDSDGDQVLDNLDLCSLEDATGYDQDGDGCLDDSDSDGFTDNLDICAGYDDRADADTDTVPDGCDQCMGDDHSGDFDDDGFCDDTDNCTLDFNPDQHDGDGDHIGNVCEADSDADGTIDDFDNCIYDVNVDQADNEGDQIGDVCDNDDDNDGVSDVTDNCPLFTNANQANFDGDGQGDACDGDDDADGVLDEADLCRATSLSVPTNASGCSGTQYVELTCPNSSPAACTVYGNHGAYLSCVTQAANDAKQQGLISGKEKGTLTSTAAKFGCNP